MMEEENESPVVSHFFSRRAKFVPKKSAEELKAASELLNKIHQEKAKECVEVTSKTDNGPCPAKKSRTRAARKVYPDFEEIIEEDVIENKADFIPTTPEVKLTAAAKRRLNRLQKERNLELKRIEAENEMILSAVSASEHSDVTEVPVDNFDSLQILTISYSSELKRFKCYKSEKFSTIFPRVADLIKLKVSEFLLCFKEVSISVDDTPESLNISDCDVLDCIPYKAGEDIEGVKYDTDKIKLTFQSNDTKQKTDMFIHKLEKMQDAMERYAELRKLPLSVLSFEFDGQNISGSETPEDLDMDSENCIDVTVLSTHKEQTPKRKKKTEVITVDSDSYDSDFLDLIEL